MDGLSSLWLVAVVATQSIAILATLIARELPSPSRVELDFFALSMWLWGGMFYIPDHHPPVLSLYVFSFDPRVGTVVDRLGEWRFPASPAPAAHRA